MRDQETIPGRIPPDFEQRVALEQILADAAKEIPILNLADCMPVEALVLPFTLGRMPLVCDGCRKPLSSQLVWRDLITKFVFCQLSCAVRLAYEKARGEEDSLARLQ